jgi:hypothetical protein
LAVRENERHILKQRKEGQGRSAWHGLCLHFDTHQLGEKVSASDITGLSATTSPAQTYPTTPKSSNKWQSSFADELVMLTATPQPATGGSGGVSPSPGSAFQSALLHLQGLAYGSPDTGTPSLAQFARNIDPAREAAAETQFLQNFAKASFKSADTNGDGKVTEGEYVQMLTNPTHSVPLTNQQAEAVWAQLDPSNSGSLSEAKYEAQMEQLFAPKIPPAS